MSASPRANGRRWRRSARRQRRPFALAEALLEMQPRAPGEDIREFAMLGHERVDAEHAVGHEARRGLAGAVEADQDRRRIVRHRRDRRRRRASEPCGPVRRHDGDRLGEAAHALAERHAIHGRHRGGGKRRGKADSRCHRGSAPGSGEHMEQSAPSGNRGSGNGKFRKADAAASSRA